VASKLCFHSLLDLTVSIEIENPSEKRCRQILEGENQMIIAKMEEM